MNAAPHILVLGAGINGAAIARELAINGLAVTVVDAADVASGATAYSSRLIHGGLRYLEYGEFGLVRESLAERTRLLTLAPQFVQPLRLFIPVATRFGGTRGALRRFFGWVGKRKLMPEPRGLQLVNAGLWLYDKLARSSTLPRRGVHRPGDANTPPVDHAKYRWLCSYWDAQILQPERFTLALLEDARRAAEEHGALFRVFTHHRADLAGRTATIAPVPRDAAVSSSEAQTSGEVADRFAPAAVINATGAWVDHTLTRLHVASPRLMGGTKGSHIVTHQPAIREALGESGVYAEADDGRPVFLLPFGDAALIGTTDLPYDRPPETAVATEAEIAYLLDAANDVFPQAALAREDVTMHYSGVRPLPFAEAETPGAVTRRHFLKEHEGGAVPLMSVIGGKLTTCRSLAEETAAAVLKRLDREPIADSRERPLPGGEGYPSDRASLAAEQRRLSDRLRYSLPQIQAVWRLCGTSTEAALAETSHHREDDRENLPDTQIPLRYVRHAIANHWPRRLSDVVERRLLLHFERTLSDSCLRRIAELMAESGVLPAGQIDAEVETCRRRLREHYGRGKAADS
ncbi:MAG: glycerol-3-phosphate dehydrogenase/oxidase [Planctomycetes bacterium]|nr:glycerol-3-phosphate dehydrogenase/oxidase [Planctomycetota bacterium]